MTTDHKGGDVMAGIKGPKRQQTIGFQLGQILLEYTDEVNVAADEAFEKVANECAKRLKETSPRRTGKYARSWTVDSARRRGHIDTYWVHNKNYYRLTHLLEKGHVIENAKGTYGRTKARPHIAPVERWAESELPAEIKRTIP